MGQGSKVGKEPGAPSKKNKCVTRRQQMWRHGNFGGIRSTVSQGVVSGGASTRRLRGFPQLGVKPPRLFLGTMSRIDPVQANELDTLLCTEKALQNQRNRPKSGHWPHFRACPLLRDEPPFLPSSAAPIEALFSLCPIYFFNRLGRVEGGRGNLGPVAVVPFPISAHRTGLAELPHPALRLASLRGTRRGIQWQALKA